VQRFLFGYAAGEEAGALTQRCLSEVGSIPAEATLGFIYATERLGSELPQILETLQRTAPQVQWLGSVGMGIAAGAKEYYDERALALMVTDIPRQAYRLLPHTTESEPRLPEPLESWCHDNGYCFGLLHAEPTYAATGDLLNRLHESLPASFINGGLSSAEGTPYQVAGAGVFAEGLSGVLFSPEVAIATDHTQGCSPIGPVHSVDQAEQNLVMRLDRRPALEVLKEDIGEVLARDLRKIGGYIFVGLPIPGSDTGDYLVRNLMGLDLEHGLIAVGDFMQGHAQMMFCRRDGNTAREDMQRMLARLKRRIGDRPIRGGIYVSCLGRGRHQFGDDSEELGMIAESLGAFPLVGFFANGELYNGRLYGYTGVLTLFL
jgi:small ligand-binding sensory domain FIST